MNDIIYMGLPSHHYFSMEHSDTFNSYIHKRLNSSYDSLEELDIYDEHPLHLFSDQDKDALLAQNPALHRIQH
jgi:hypothetical protein